MNDECLNVYEYLCLLILVGMHDLRNMLCFQNAVFVSKLPDLFVYSFEGSKSICLPGRLINAINHVKDHP